MEEIKLDVQVRNQIGRRKVKKLRREDSVPAVVYGEKEEGSTAIQVDRRSYERVMRAHQGQRVIFHLNVMDGEKKLKDYSAIVKEEQHSPVSDALLHIDFHHISLTEKLEVKVPVVTKGEAPGVKNDGGSLDHTLWELDIICLPTNIPEKISIDVSKLKIGDSVHIKDIVLPEGVETHHDPEAILVSVVPPMKEIEESTGEEGVEPEVIKEKKAADEGAEGKAEEKAEGKEA